MPNDKFHEAMDRAERFKKEINAADPITRAALLADWKEILLEEIVSLLEVTEDTRLLGHLDSNIGLGLTVTANEGDT